MRLVTPQNEIHEAIWNWIFNGNNGISELSFIAANYDKDNNIISDKRIIYTPETVGKSELLQKYIRNKGKYMYSFGIQQYAPITTTTNTKSNIVTLKAFEVVSDWVKEQYILGNLPIFPEGCIIDEIEVTPGSVAAVDKNGAKFQLIINISYWN